MPANPHDPDDRLKDLADAVRDHCATPAQVQETLSALIDQRYHDRDRELQLLKAKEQQLLQRLQATQIDRMLEELRCFKDVNPLQGYLNRHHDPSNR